VEILEFFIVEANLKDITELAAENMKEVKIGWSKKPSIEQVLPVLAKWRQLRKLTLCLDFRHFPPVEVFCDFIMRLKHLTYLRLYDSSNPKLKPLIDKINEFVLPRRPNFDLKI
jgi:hypothetical protein